MPGLLLTGVAMCVALIMVAALVVVRHWRRSKGQSRAPVGARAAAGPIGNAMAPHEIAIVPGFSNTVPPGPGAQVPVPSGHAAHPPGQAAHPPAGLTAGPQPDPHGPGPPPPTGQRAIARALTTSEQIASYYDQADKPLADYLTAMGWIHQPHSQQPPGPAERARRHPPSGGADGKARAPDGRPGTHQPRIAGSAP